MRNVLLLPVAFLFLFLVGIALRDATSSTREGDQPYTPTRLEWLEVRSNAYLGYRSPHGGISFRIRPGRNTIVIHAVPNANAPAIEVKRMRNIQFVTQLAVKAEAKRRGWDKWLRVECDPPDPVAVAIPPVSR